MLNKKSLLQKNSDKAFRQFALLPEDRGSHPVKQYTVRCLLVREKDWQRMIDVVEDCKFESGLRSIPASTYMSSHLAMVGGDAELIQKVPVIFDSLGQNTLEIRNPGVACSTLTDHGLWVINETHVQINISSCRPGASPCFNLAEEFSDSGGIWFLRLMLSASSIRLSRPADFLTQWRPCSLRTCSRPKHIFPKHTFAKHALCRRKLSKYLSARLSSRSHNLGVGGIGYRAARIMTLCAAARIRNPQELRLPFWSLSASSSPTL